MVKFNYFKKTFTVFITSIFFFGTTANAMFSEDYEPQASPVQRITIGEHEIFTSSMTLKSGEIAYFGFEPIIDEDRSKKWRTYSDFADLLSKDNRGMLSVFSIFVERNEQLEQVQESAPQEVIPLLKSLQQPKKFREALRGVCSGITGMHKGIGDYVTYVSKKPITGFFPFAEPGSPEKVAIKDWIQHHINHYDDLVMSVSSFNLDDMPKVYEHRGIFRNPMSMLRGDYKGLGMYIHAFTGVARSLQNPSLEYMTVNPDANVLMRTLLLKAFSADELYPGSALNDTTYEPHNKKFSQEASEQFIQEAGFKPNNIAIKLSALKSKFPAERSDANEN